MDVKNIVRSVFIWITTSLGIATALYLFGKPFLPSLLLVLIAQYFIGDIIFRVMAAKDIAKAREVELEITDKMTKQYATVDCPCDQKSSQLVMLNINEENLYKCNKCDKELKCMVGWKSVQTTTPLTEDPFKKFDFTKNTEYQE
jgi:hypothetical protein